MAIIYDMNYMKKCDERYEGCLKLAERSRDYHNKLLNYKPKGIIKKIRRAYLIKYCRFVNKVSINCAEYWIGRKATAITKGVLHAKTNFK